MPSNADFSMRILIGDEVVLPEYEHNGEVYVESNLFTPYSFKQRSEQVVNGEVEKQNWPVTPFMISVESTINTPPTYYRINIDGQKVKGLSLGPNERRIVKGFKDGGVLKEFLFSLPRFAMDEDDRIDMTCHNHVGKVEILCYNARKRKTGKRLHGEELTFEQANKKDSSSITKGKYLMATTKAGRVISNRPLEKWTDFWDIHSIRSTLSVKYVTPQTLQDMGLSIIPIPFPANVLGSSRRLSQKNDTGLSMTPDLGSRFKGQLTGSGTVVLDLTQETPSCSFSRNVKPEIGRENDKSEADLKNLHKRRKTTSQDFSLPPSMQNATIDLTEDDVDMDTDNSSAKHVSSVDSVNAEENILDRENIDNIDNISTSKGDVNSNNVDSNKESTEGIVNSDNMSRSKSDKEIVNNESTEGNVNIDNASRSKSDKNDNNEIVNKESTEGNVNIDNMSTSKSKKIDNNNKESSEGSVNIDNMSTSKSDKNDNNETITKECTLKSSDASDDETAKENNKTNSPNNIENILQTEKEIKSEIISVTAVENSTEIKIESEENLQ